jgi:hypothetical protein
MVVVTKSEMRRMSVKIFHLILCQCNTVLMEECYLGNIAHYMLCRSI